MRHNNKNTRAALAWIFLFALTAAGCSGGSHHTQTQASRIDSISPSAARAGEPVTVSGVGFGASNVAVEVGGVSAQIVSATGTSITFDVPSGISAGSTLVTASNPGEPAGQIAFTVLEGILLPGDPDALMSAVNNDLRERADAAAVQDGVVMNRLDVRFATDATVDQVNTALRTVEGGIVSMSVGLPSVTIAIPTQASLDALEAFAARLEGEPGVRFVEVAELMQPEVVFSGGGVGFAELAAEIRHLLPSRFPAAWNVARRDLFGNPSTPQPGFCSAPPTAVLVADAFSTPAPADFGGLVDLAESPADPPTDLTSNELAHGYLVSDVLEANALGAQAFGLASGCDPLHLIQVFGAGPTMYEVIDNLVDHMPPNDDTDKFIVNLSLGFADECQDAQHCQPPHDRLYDPVVRADDALYWKEKTRDRWQNFLIVVAGGNSRDDQSAAIYPGMGDARFISPMSIAQLSDTRFTFAGDDNFWAPSAVFQAQGFQSLTASASELAALAETVTDAGMTDAVADNVIVVGSATSQPPDSTLSQHVAPEQLGESLFSNSCSGLAAGSCPDVLAVGQDVFGQSLEGTSLSAPAVAGLAAYLWMLSPNLKQNQPASITKRTIVANARNRIIDAYGSVLSLDAAAPPTPDAAPIRLALLDVTGSIGADGGEIGDHRFDEEDIDAFLRALFLVAADDSITLQAAPATTADFSRFDLNGDGFTTAGARRERFDLDRVGSTQFGATQYSDVSEQIEGQEIHFDETALTDLEILCYYAYSALFEGNADARNNLLDGRCAHITVTVDPASVSLSPGGAQQFVATVTGANDPRVTWSVDGGGTIDAATGLFTAGSTAGTFTVRATSVIDANVFGEATATVVVPPSPFLVLEAYAAAGAVQEMSSATAFPVPVSASDSGASASFTASLTGNQIVWSGSATSVDNGAGALGHVLLEFTPSQDTMFTVHVNSSWVVDASGPTATAGIGAQVQSSSGDAVAHYEVSGGSPTDQRITATVQVMAGETVDILLEGVVGSGGSGAGDGATVTFDPVP